MLLVICLLFAFAVNGVRAILHVPDPPEIYSASELLVLYNKAVNSEDITPFRYQEQAEVSRPDKLDWRDSTLAEVLADHLGLSRDQVILRSGRSDNPQEDGAPERWGQRGDGPPGPPPGEDKSENELGFSDLLPWPDTLDPYQMPGDGRSDPFGLAPSQDMFRDLQGMVAEGPFFLAVRQDEGRWLVLRSPSPPLLSPYVKETLLWLLGGVLVMVPLAHFFARTLTRPILKFARAAEQMGIDPEATISEVDGPAELGTVAHALNQMRDSLQAYVRERTDMVGAIAHDLRTPLTRLTYRLDAAPEDIREKAAADIAEMEEMIVATLTLVREAGGASEREKLELRSLLESVTNDFSDMGHDVQLTAEAPVVISGDPLALRRLFGNLLSNAVKFGHRARCRMEKEEDFAVIEIEDDGPGLDEEDLERVFEPFYRTDRSRNRKTGGFGLGLTVVKSIVLAHNGSVELHNGKNGGIVAIVRLPVFIDQG
ncbi:HAMP domain-containing sensor histidine kinase [Emcibacter nanhaiensis]|uniref:HAMP domain-containing sensor histidine kinase n=1 Tax=Emcibacter nanhaiensis TaxID=1505037 RepID=UPI0015E4071B|nr:HAMP domain-containing sensor histidine kinase [Emcibacter nanhaiensis]